VITSLERLKGLDGIRGCNIVVADQADLASLEQIAGTVG
jgi:hypothetical protein